MLVFWFNLKPYQTYQTFSQKCSAKYRIKEPKFDHLKITRSLVALILPAFNNIGVWVHNEQ